MRKLGVGNAKFDKRFDSWKEGADQDIICVLLGDCVYKGGPKYQEAGDEEWDNSSRARAKVKCKRLCKESSQPKEEIYQAISSIQINNRNSSLLLDKEVCRYESVTDYSGKEGPNLLPYTTVKLPYGRLIEGIIGVIRRLGNQNNIMFAFSIL